MPIVNTLKIDNTDYVIQDKRYDGLTGFTYKGTVESYSELPTSDVSAGDTYYIKKDGSGNYGYNVTAYYNEGNIAWGQSSGTTINDVRVNDSSIVINGTAYIPTATDTAIGVVRATGDYGILVDAEGRLKINPAEESDIAQREYSEEPIVPHTLDYAVKSAMCDGIGETWTDTEKVAAQKRIGVEEYDRRIHLLEEAALGKLYTDETVTETSYQQTVPSGSLSSAIVSEWGGKSLAWTQIVPNGNFTSTSGWKKGSTGHSFVIANNEITLNVNSISVRSRIYREDLSIIGNHKYYVHGELQASTNAQPLYIRIGGVDITRREYDANTWYSLESVIAATADGTTITLAYGVDNSHRLPDGGTLSARNVFATDLTAMFGAGNEPTTTDDPRIAAIEAYAAEHPEYNAGEIVSADVVSVDTESGNLFNYGTATLYSAYIEAQSHRYSTGSNGEKSTIIAVKPHTTYTVSTTDRTGGKLRVGAFDSVPAIGNIASIVAEGENSGDGYSATITTNEETYLAIFCWNVSSSADGILGKIQVEYGTEKTAYKPYVAPTNVAIPSSVLAQYPLRSAGNVYDTISWDGSKWKHTKRVTDAIHMKGNTWTIGSYNQFRTVSSIIGGDGHGIHYLCDALQSVSFDNRGAPNDGEPRISFSYSDTGWDVRGTSFQRNNPVDLDGFVAWLETADPVCYAELTTPVVTDITDLMGDWRGIIEVEQGGTVTFAQSDGKIFPIPNTINYLVKTTGGA